jgi:hypothetical protein
MIFKYKGIDMKSLYRTITLSVAFILGCSSTPPTSAVDDATMVTRVHLTNQCTITEAELESYGSALALALVPPLVESGLNALGGAIKKAGEAEIFTTSHLTTMDFYTLGDDGTTFASNQNEACLVVYRANIGYTGAGDDLINSKVFGDRATKLYRDYRIVGVPSFYYEALLQPSNDRSAFRLEPRFAFYGESLGVKKKVKELVLTFNFAKPHSSSEGKTFAAQSITFKRGDSPLVIEDPELLTGYASGYMNIPAISKPASESLTLYGTQRAQIKQFEDQLFALDRVDDPEVAKLSKDLALAKSAKASKLQTALTKLEHAKKDGESEAKILELKRVVDAIVTDEEAGVNIANLESAISARRGALTGSAQRVNLTRSIAKLKGNIARSEQLLNRSTPVNVTATLVETSNANQFLIALGTAIEGAAGTAKTKVTEALTPEDPETKLGEDVTFLTKLNGLRTKAIGSVEQWRLAGIAYSNATATAKGAAHSALRIKYFQASLDCNIVELNDIFEPACLALEEPPELE